MIGIIDFHDKKQQSFYKHMHTALHTLNKSGKILLQFHQIRRSFLSQKFLLLYSILLYVDVAVL